MSSENETRALSIVIAEQVLSRLKTQMVVVFVVSILVAGVLGTSLTWQYQTLSRLADARISEYRLLVAENLQELHRIDLQEAASRTRPVRECERSLPAEDAGALLERELGRPPERGEIRLLLEKAEGFGVCDIGVVQHTLDDPLGTAKVDTVYRLLLNRPADPIGRFIYGYWLASGVSIEAVGRDIMTSPEFLGLKKLSLEP